nr:immunoglobulin heavy chain junction region [Mus musculus]MBK4198290.1 immunoglobulin heavy chain junction region [Mus musculus]MBK4198291.1 immunoglobulin heavy chain junction region [Mus musculus]
CARAYSNPYAMDYW